jgi:hypothetical protein
MTGGAAGVETRLQNYMHVDCPLLENMVRSTSTRPSYGAYHDHCGRQHFLQHDFQIHYSPQLSAETDRRNGHNMPSFGESMAFNIQGHQVV